MSDIQKTELARYHNEMVDDVKSLVEKYRRIMDWDIPENDSGRANSLVIEALKEVIADIEQEESAAAGPRP